MARLEDAALAEARAELERALARWQELAGALAEAHTDSGIPVAPVYTPLDAPEEGYLERTGLPGEYPFARGIYRTMYRGQLWTMRLYAGWGGPEDTNERFRYLLEQGQTGLSVALDLPTQMGLDSDHELAAGEVGKAGVAIDTVADMERVFEGIPLDRVSTSFTINATAPILLAMYQVVGEKQGVDPAALRGTVQNDILKEFIARGCYIYPAAPSMRLATDLIEYACKNLPQWNFISISGYHVREAGSTAAQELGFTIANGIGYAEEAIRRGIDPDLFGRRVSFFFNGHSDFFEEIAKFRAARRMWARLMRERFGAKDPRAWMLRFHTQTAGSTLTAQQPENNVVRVALQALAATLGGTQSLHTNALDEALALPSERAASIALRTQQILANEIGIQDAADPFGGSWHLEKETDRIEREAQAIIDEIAKRGGPAPAIAQRYYQSEIEKSAVAHQRALEAGKKVVVGVNRFVEKENGAVKVKLLRINEKVRTSRIRRVEAAKKKRDAGKARAALDRLKSDAAGSTNLMDGVLEAVRASVTLGEISHALRGVFGIYDQSRRE